MSPFIETIRIEQGMAYNLAAHNQRMNATRAALYGCTDTLDISNYITPDLPHERTKCRVEYTHEITAVTYAPYQIRPVASLQPVVCDTIDYGYKSTDREFLNLLFACRGAHDEVLIVKQGLLTDTSIANIALYTGTHWLTPVCPLLQGTQRAALLRCGKLTEAAIAAHQLAGFTHLMLFNALIDWGELVLPISAISPDFVSVQNG